MVALILQIESNGGCVMRYYDYPVPMHDGWWGLGMMLFWGIVLVILAVVAARYLRTNNGMSSRTDLLDIIKERYARGEINKKEYEDLRKDLSVRA